MSDERKDLARKVCAVMGWKVRCEADGDVIAYVPAGGTRLEARRVLSYDVAALLRLEILRRGLEDRFLADLRHECIDMHDMGLHYYGDWMPEHRWRIVNATPEQTALAFLAAIEGGRHA